MPDIGQLISPTLTRLDLRALVDIFVVACIFYWVLSLLRGTTGMTVLRGIVVLVLGSFILGNVLRLNMFNWLLRNSLAMIVIAIPILFQPEIRRVLERIGRTSLRTSAMSPAFEQLAGTIAEACRRLSDRRYGALIVVERETGLQEWIDTGIPLEAVVTTELLLTIFSPTVPLHDGAVLLRDGRVIAAGCVLPLSENVAPDSQLGTRHRAAIGISEVTDALAIVVSEETGIISVANGGKLVRPLDEIRLRRLLLNIWGGPGVAPFRQLWQGQS